MLFDEFANKVKAAGLIPRDCGNGHWQIRGGKYCVNFYPGSWSMYVNGTHKGLKHRITIQDVINAAHDPVSDKSRGIAPRRQNRFYRGAKKRLLKTDSHCYWCSKELDSSTGTIDHMIPLSKGGTNGTDNLVLACKECNEKRKNYLPESTPWEKLT